LRWLRVVRRAAAEACHRPERRAYERELTRLGGHDDSDSAARRVSRRARPRSGAGCSRIEDVRITAKSDQMLIPLPEGASYLGFIFARADDPAPPSRRCARTRATVARHRTRSADATIRPWLNCAGPTRRRLHRGTRAAARSSV
jgi:hypothetical protein